MVAIFILLVGLLGVVAMLNHATTVAGTNNGRVGATNLAREILEDARSIDYEQLNPTQIAGALQGRPGLGGSGNPWTLNRRGVDYSAQVTVCTLDQPKDGLAATPPQNACPRGDGDPRRARRDQPRRLPQRDRCPDLERPRTEPDAYAELSNRQSRGRAWAADRGLPRARAHH